MKIQDLYIGRTVYYIEDFNIKLSYIYNLVIDTYNERINVVSPRGDSLCSFTYINTLRHIKIGPFSLNREQFKIKKQFSGHTIFFTGEEAKAALREMLEERLIGL